MTPRQAAEWLSDQGIPVSAKTVRRWIREEGLPAFKFGNSRYHVRMSVLRAELDKLRGERETA